MDFSGLIERAFDVGTIVAIMGLTQVIKNMSWVKPYHVPWIPAILGMVAGPIHLISSMDVMTQVPMAQFVTLIIKYGLGYGGAAALVYQLVLEPFLKARQAKKDSGE